MEKIDRSHAIIPKYRHGRLEGENRADLTLDLHAFHHLLTAESCTGNDKEANSWAVRAIVRRMEPQTLERFNKLVDLHEKDRRNGGW
jgi:hypothetical protein